MKKNIKLFVKIKIWELTNNPFCIFVYFKISINADCFSFFLTILFDEVGYYIDYSYECFVKTIKI